MSCRDIEGLFMIKKRYDEALLPVQQRHNVTRMELDILLYLANNPGLDTAAEIVRYRRLTKSHVSTSVQSLTERGLLSGERRVGNQKAIHLKALSAANAVIQDGRRAQQAFMDRLFRGFTSRERSKFQKMIQRLSQNMSDGTE